MFVIVSDIFSAFNISSHMQGHRQTRGKGQLEYFGLVGGPSNIVKRSKYSNKTVTLIQQSDEYSHSMDN